MVGMSEYRKPQERKAARQNVLARVFAATYFYRHKFSVMVQILCLQWRLMVRLDYSAPLLGFH